MSLLKRMSIRQKLMLLGLMVLLAVSLPTYLQIRTAQTLAAAAQGEHEGIGPARELVRLVQLTQQHRGLSAALLGGKTEVQSARDAKRAEVQQQIDKLGPQLSASWLDDAARTLWREDIAQWAQLQSQVTEKALKAGESSTKHAQLIAAYFKLLDKIVDQSGLILDPEADTYFLMTATLLKLPFATEALGQTRARGAGFLAEGQIDAAGRATLAGLVQLAGEHQGGMVAAFEKSFASNAALKKDLGTEVAALGARVQASLQLTREELILKEQLSHAAPAYIKNYTETIDSLYTVGFAALERLDALLADRSSSLRRGSLLMMGMLGLLLVGFVLLLRMILLGITEPLQRAAELAQQIAERDLSGEFSNEQQDEVGRLTSSLLAMRDSLSGVIRDLRGNAGEVATAAREVATGNQDLSQRTEQQASALQQTASSMEELTGTVQSNAGQAAEASALAKQACQTALDSGAAVQQVVQTMGGIEASSRKIEEIISVIDGIAFQTNILALNAAVEAARAGEQGRGFAVVAGEVRLLAQRSADAAKQIKQLIASSVEQVEGGVKQVHGAGATMQEAVTAIRSLAEMVDRISLASGEQSGGLAQINQAVSHMDELTQQNAALVEQTAAAGMSLQDQAQRLSSLVGTFRLRA